MDDVSPSPTGASASTSPVASIALSLLSLPGLGLLLIALTHPARSLAHPDAAVLAAVFGSFGALLLAQAWIVRPGSQARTLPWWVFALLCGFYVALEAFAVTRWRAFIEASRAVSGYQGSREAILALALPVLLALGSGLLALVLRPKRED